VLDYLMMHQQHATVPQRGLLAPHVGKPGIDLGSMPVRPRPGLRLE